MPVLGIYLARQEIRKGTSGILLLSLTAPVCELSGFFARTRLPPRLLYPPQVVELAQMFNTFISL